MQIESQLKMENLKVESAIFSREEKVEIDPKGFKIDVSMKNLENEYFKTSILAIIQKVPDITLSVLISAEFHFESGSEIPEDIKSFIKRRNSVTIIFPYLRSFITTMTCQPNLTPIILPPININALLDELDNKRQSPEG